MDLNHIQMVVIDLDGTLLNNKKECRERTQQAVKKLIEKGVKVCLATGRAYENTENVAKSCGIHDCIATVNGACIHENGEVVHAIELGRDVIQGIVEYSRKNNLFLWMYTRDGVFRETTNELYDELIRNFPFFETPKINFDDVHATFKSLFIARPNTAQTIIKDFAQNPALNVVLTSTNTVDTLPPHDPIYYVEMLNKSVSKGTALEWMSKHYNIPRENILALGDENNDIEMLKYAGVSVAMGNSEPHIKEMTDYVTLTNEEDGVADFIEKHLL